MDLADVGLLTSPAGRRLLADLPPYDERLALSTGDLLRRAGHPPPLVAACLTQSRLRTRAGQRWGASGSALLPRLLLTPDGAEQATRPSVAALRAERYRRLGDGALMADLGCGVGLDALAVAAAGLQVVGYELNQLTAAVATANAAATGRGSQVRVLNADVVSLPDSTWANYRGAFADPARRQGGRRLMHPEAWSPPLSWVLDLPMPHLGVKVAPGLAHDRVPDGCEFAVVSDGGDVVEAAIYRGILRDGSATRSATLIRGGVSVTDADLPSQAPPTAPIGQFLHEPDGAVIRAGLVAVAVHEVDGWLIDPRIAYICTDHEVTSPLLTSYRVDDVMPFSLKRLRRHLRENQIGRVVIKKRGSAIDVDELRHSLRLDRSASERRTLVLTRIGDDPIVAVCRPIGPAT